MPRNTPERKVNVNFECVVSLNCYGKAYVMVARSGILC